MASKKVIDEIYHLKLNVDDLRKTNRSQELIIEHLSKGSKEMVEMLELCQESLLFGGKFTAKGLIELNKTIQKYKGCVLL